MYVEPTHTYVETHVAQGSVARTVFYRHYSHVSLVKIGKQNTQALFL